MAEDAFKLYLRGTSKKGNNYGSHSIIINVSGKGFQLYTFTFG